MSELPPYKPRKDTPVSQSTGEPLEFIALDWYECDLLGDTEVEKGTFYLNQEHNKQYTIFIFGVSSKGHSVCLRVKGYNPYFYVQIPDEFTKSNEDEFLNSFDSSRIDDLEDDDISNYETAISKRDYKLAEIIKRKAKYYMSALIRDRATIQSKKIFWTFMNEQKCRFAKLPFKSKMGYQFVEKMFKSPLKLNISNHQEEIKYNLFESDLEPVLRFLHDKKIKPSSWIHIPKNKYKLEIHQSKAQINISAEWTVLEPLDKPEIPPLLIASFDIEADSSHGDFPIAKKDCKKLSNQLVITWIRDQRVIEKKQYEKLYTQLIQSKAIQTTTTPTTTTTPETPTTTTPDLLENVLMYVDKKDESYDKEVLLKIKPVIMDYNDHMQALNSATTQSSTTQTTTVQSTVKPYSEKMHKVVSYYKEVMKYIKAKESISFREKFFDVRIRKALGFEQFKKIDDEIDLIYLKGSVRAKQFVNAGGEYNDLVYRIFRICDHPIRKVKANTIMKKAQNEVAAIETAKIAANPRFTMDDLIKIITDTARKYKIGERDLQDKIITKETMVRFINMELNRAFGMAKGDTVIQIGTVFWRYGESQPCHNNIITLNSCTPFNIGNKPCEVIARDMERDVLLEWSKLIERHDPDIIIGYNTFGFDESFMYDRITDLALNMDRVTLSRDDMKALDGNKMYQSFINLGRFDPEIVKRVPDAKGGIVNKKLSSSALGDNFMYYFNTPGRVQIDLLKVCQASLTKLPSYKLDSVSEFYISGKIKDVKIQKTTSTTTQTTTPTTQQQLTSPEESAVIKVENIQELEIGNYIVISMSSTTAKLYDGDKLKILDIDRENSLITLDRPIPKSCLSSVPIWGLGKDDVSPQDIFRLQKGTADDRAEIAKYCIQDCALLIRLLRKLEVINNNFGMSNVCLVPFSYIFLRGQGIKAFSLITNECAKEDFLLPVLERIEQEEVDVDDTVRRQHTNIAQQMEHEDDGDDLTVEDSNTNILDSESATSTSKKKVTFDLAMSLDNSDDDGSDADDTDDAEDTSSTLETSTISTQSTQSSISKQKVVKIKKKQSIEEDDPAKHVYKLPSDFNKIVMTDESYEGALVMKPVTDIYTSDPITVLDFSSLYPSEMITSDLSHDRICEDPYWLGPEGAKRLEKIGLGYLDRTYDNFEWVNPKIKSKGKRKCGTTTVRYVQYPDGRKGLIPRILMGLLASRKATKKRMEATDDPFQKALLDGLQLAYKVTANSVYGQIGARTSKMYKPQIAASTTLGGRLMITGAMKFITDNYPDSKKIYSDTDSTFIKFHLLRDDGTPPTTDQEKIELAIKKGQEVEKNIKKILPGVHALAYEKVLFPFILISKKRYFALKYEDDPTKCKQLSMGLVLKRRDNAPILKHIYIGVLDSLVKDKNIPKAIEYVQNECKKMVDSKFDMNMFVISKTLSAYYKDPEAIAHAILAQRMGERDPGNKPQSNERIPYVFIKIKEEPGIEYLQGDRIEHVEYVRQNKLQPDYEKYILNQIMKPVSQLFELVVERLPNFPYGRGYYEEMYNIWYNKYEGDELKTEKKIKQLKAQMVQKLVFDPLVLYAQLKVSKTKTIDEWFKPQEEPSSNTEQVSVNTVNTMTTIKTVKQDNHNVKIKKSKQMSLDAFFK
jgi:DNA polymerase elongation subunit (family B)